MPRLVSFAGLLLVALGFIEIAGIVLVASWIGNTPTVILLLASAIAGFWVLRIHGRRALRVLQERDSDTHAPTAVAESLLGSVAGGLLILPGFISSIAATVLLIPLVQRVVAKRSLRRLGRWLPSSVSERLTGPVHVRSHRAAPPQTGSEHTTVQPDAEGGVVEAEHMIVIATEDDEPATGGKPDPK
ncbi:MAG TPA: FxsA family protein [Mycobacteriales bacterium]|jgi:UPF0716 protein FxsA|nr:FxsA family protein [Mycobacteriales bacterium]